MNSDFTFGLKTYRSFFQQEVARIPFSKGGVVALVGPNNAGKSVLIRSIYELKNVLAVYVGSGGWKQNGAEEWEDSGRGSTFQFPGTSDPLDLVPAKLLAQQKKIEFEIATSNWSCRIALQGEQLYEVGQIIRPSSTEAFGQEVAEVRSIAQILSRAIYIGPYRNISNQAAQGQGTHYDLPIGEDFVRAWREHKTGSGRQSKVAVLDTQKEIAELLGFDSLEINSSSDDKTLSLTIDGTMALSLADVGAGVAQLIFTVISVANRKPSVILIDEPELHLHPAMQAKFVETLSKYSEFGVVFATHSIGLARQVASKILVVSRDNKSGKSSVRTLEGTANAAQLLGEMSYSQFSALGGSHLLLVEGTTEVKTMRVLLRKLGIDGHVMIIPLGGTSLIGSGRADELQEFKRIGADVFVLIDSERGSEDEPLTKERGGFQDTCSRIFGAERVFLTKRRATENYLSDRAIKAVKSEKYRALTSFEKLDSCDPKWAKNENWRIAEEMELDEIEGTDLGKFLIGLKDSVHKSKLTPG